MSWLLSQLKDAEDAGDKVHIVSHINGGDGESLEGWDINFYNAVNRFTNTISGIFMGHTHYQTFYMIYSDPENHTSTPTNVVYSAPSLTPYNEFYPAYRIYTIDGNYPGSTFQVVDFADFYFNLTENNANPTNPTWKQLYASVNQEYGLKSHIPSEWNNMIERMKTDDDLFAKYRKNYYRRTEYDGVKECGKLCRDEMICKTRKFHHSLKLCEDLHVLDTSVNKKPLYRRKSTKPKIHRNLEEFKMSIKQKRTQWALKRRDSENCPL
ncbi:hypothetical protein WR25_26820 [Diploscapter pachys]|uniref:Sphingomyelin phosphodiesterase C-terminal domain-containing protein n=1 Tax=Diploscapter pachys TaxID=2018661 RepID=A0A2A2KKS3_9BILA|nr:hypothetical protein WR25_26820 [Diploscapter pachys]